MLLTGKVEALLAGPRVQLPNMAFSRLEDIVVDPQLGTLSLKLS